MGWLSSGFGEASPLFPPPFILQESSKDVTLQEQFDTLLKKMSLRACFLSLGPRFSSARISRVLLTCSSSRNVDVQHQFENTYFHFPFHPVWEIPPGTLQREDLPVQSHTFSLSLAPWLFTMVARKFASLIHAQNTVLRKL